MSGEDVLILISDYPGDASGQMGNATRRRTDENMMYDIDSTLHMLDVELGWEWHNWHPVVIRTAIGLAWTLGAKTAISPKKTPKYPQFTDALARYGEDYLDDLYTTYVISPTVSLGVGYEF